MEILLLIVIVAVLCFGVGVSIGRYNERAVWTEAAKTHCTRPTPDGQIYRVYHSRSETLDDEIEHAVALRGITTRVGTPMKIMTEEEQEAERKRVLKFDFKEK